MELIFSTMCISLPPTLLRCFAQFHGRAASRNLENCPPKANLIALRLECLQRFSRQAAAATNHVCVVHSFLPLLLGALLALTTVFHVYKTAFFYLLEHFFRCFRLIFIMCALLGIFNSIPWPIRDINIEITH